MDETPTYLLTLFTALGCGLMAGLFFVFSVFAMKALDRLGPAQAVAAMQSINVAIITPLFMVVFMGTAIACIVLGVIALVDLEGDEQTYVLLGCGLYLVTVMAMTFAYHIPRNNALARLDPNTPDATNYWARYFKEWTRGNHVRTLGSLGALASFIAAIRVG